MNTFYWLVVPVGAELEAPLFCGESTESVSCPLDAFVSQLVSSQPSYGFSRSKWMTRGLDFGDLCMRYTTSDSRVVIRNGFQNLSPDRCGATWDSHGGKPTLRLAPLHMLPPLGLVKDTLQSTLRSNRPPRECIYFLSMRQVVDPWCPWPLFADYDQGSLAGAELSSSWLVICGAHKYHTSWSKIERVRSAHTTKSVIKNIFFSY